MADHDSFDRPVYQRPHARYQCDGTTPCSSGPEPNGACGATACEPEQRDGRWFCRRTMASGGPCALGPLPDGRCGCQTTHCVPRGSLRRSRGRMVLVAIGIAVAFIAVGLGGPWRGEFLAPGPLCQAHARLLGDLQGSDRCAACHDATSSSTSAWLASVFNPHALGAVQSERCLKCHDSTFEGTAALAAHSLPHETLASITADRHRQLNSGDWLERLVAWPAKSGEHTSIACATCHREHHGEQDLTKLTDRQCQTCHVERYHAFEVDHPEFSQWPSPVTRHLAFDHATHETKHFIEKGQVYRCDLCHQSDDTRRLQTLRPFEDACAGCHTEGIAVSTLAGLDFLRLPRLDVEVLRSAGLDPGDWPLEASGEFDGAFSEPILALVAGDPQAAAAMQKLNDIDFAWLATEDPEILEAANSLSWSVKRLLYELATADRVSLEQRLIAANLGHPESRAKFLASLPFAQFEETIAVWFPDLELEMARFTSPQKAAAPTNSSPPNAHGPSEENTPSVDHEPQERSDSSPEAKADLLAIFASAFQEVDREQKQLAENPLQKWKAKNRDLGSASENGPTQSNDAAMTESIPGNLEPAETASENGLPHSESIDAQAEGTGTRSSNSNGGERLAENPLRGWREGLGIDRGENSNPEPSDPRVAESPETREEPTSQSGSADPTMDDGLANQEAGATTTDASATDLEPLPWRHSPAQKIGWVRDDVQFRLTYYPQGHADAMLSDWIELLRRGGLEESGESTNDPATAGTQDKDRLSWVSTFQSEPSSVPSAPDHSQSHAWTSAWSDRLLSPEGFGGCVRCHVAPVQPVSGPFLWQGYRRDVSRGEFTAFSHGPHLVSAETQVCQDCHRLESFEASAATLVRGAGNDGLRSDFRSLSVSDCAACHRSGHAPHGCSTCHDYHVGALRLHP